jgi:polysaccharide export outer membrane protein
MRTMAIKKPGLICSLILPFALIGNFSYAQQPALRIAPGDVLDIRLYDTPEMEQTPRVAVSGDVELALIGKVHVATLTPAEAARAIEDALVAKNIMKHPSVTIIVTAYEAELVAVAGEVNHPGPIQITAPRSAIDLITLSGGLTDLADRHKILIRHKNPADSPTIFFFSNDPNEALQNDVMVQPGDTIVVPRCGIVYVLGDVGRPGGFPIDQPDSRMSALKAVTLAGATNHTATPSKARLIRRTAEGGYQEVKVNFSRIQKGTDPDIPLVAGDVLYIPFSYVKNALALGSSSLVTTAAQAAIYTH